MDTNAIAVLPNSPKKRGRPPTGNDPLTAFRAPADLLHRIEKAAKLAGVSKSDLMRQLIEEGLQRGGA